MRGQKTPGKLDLLQGIERKVESYVSTSEELAGIVQRNTELVIPFTQMFYRHSDSRNAALPWSVLRIAGEKARGQGQGVEDQSEPLLEPGSG